MPRYLRTTANGSSSTTNNVNAAIEMNCNALRSAWNRLIIAPSVCVLSRVNGYECADYIRGAVAPVHAENGRAWPHFSSMATLSLGRRRNYVNVAACPDLRCDKIAAQENRMSTESASEPELVEEDFVGEEEDERLPLSIAPADRKLVTHPYDFIVTSLKTQIDEGTLVLADKFQRRRVWDDAKASRLIESLMLNVPIPICYFAELENNTYSVIDGQQRLTAIYRFLNNEFALR